MMTATATEPVTRSFCSGAGLSVKQGSSGVGPALKEVGLDWTVIKEPIQGVTSRTVFPDKVMTITSDGVPVGIVGDNYGVVNNAEAFAIADSLLETGKYMLEGFVNLRDGAVVRCELKFKEPVPLLKVGDENAHARVSIITSHDGSTQTVATSWLERLRCTNGMRSLHPSRLFAVRHTAKAAERLALVTDLREELGNVLEAAQARAAVLAGKKMTDKAMRAAVAKAYNVKPDAKVVESTMVHLQLTETVDDDLRDTAWGLYNALTERNEWASASRSREAAFVSSWNGRGAHAAQRLVAALAAV